tara:strand:- start:8 stop:151 length:144 start_codon:yes stop_codon:yes gene_type:complete
MFNGDLLKNIESMSSLVSLGRNLFCSCIILFEKYFLVTEFVELFFIL